MSKCAFRLLRLMLFTLALVGLGVSSYLVYLHYGKAAEGGMAARLCSGAFDCDSVLQSRWGTLPGPVRVPIALVGAGYFIFLAVWLAIVGRLPGKLHHACIGPALLATLGAVESTHLIYVMGAKLHAWCGFCLATHAVNYLMTIGLWAQYLAGCRRQPPEELAAAAQRQLWKIPALAMMTACMLGVTLMSLAGLAGMVMLYNTMAGQVAQVQRDEQYQRWKFAQAAPRAVLVRPDDPALGPADAPHTVVMFGDFQCTHCAATDKTLKQVQQRLGNTFRIVFKHYPLNRGCNASMEPDKAGHAFACMASQAAEAARRLGGNEAFWKLHDALYENQRSLDEKPYSALAAKAGLDAGAFTNLLTDPSVRERIEQDAALGHQLGVVATPVLFLDGRQVTLDVVVNAEQNTDLDATVRHWEGMLAVADSAPATQPTQAPGAPGSQPIASLQD